ncbi:MAG: hypothetical protein IT462_06870 [Planctomycetes bacterium]|nr:hypothetical protein [Planctomycetota bacterium]
MRIALIAVLSLLATDAFAQTHEWDGFILVKSRAEIEKAPRGATKIRARALPEADLPALTRFADLEYLDLCCNQNLTDKAFLALRALPEDTAIDFGGCRNVSTSAMTAFCGYNQRGPRRKILWKPATLIDGEVSAVENDVVTIALGRVQRVHVGQRFEVFDKEPALGGSFQGVVEVKEVGDKTSKADLLYTLGDKKPASGAVLVNRLWRDGRYLNFWLAGKFEAEQGFLTRAEISGYLKSKGAQQQSDEFAITPSVELVVMGSEVFLDDAYRYARNRLFFSTVSECGMRMYVDANARVHRFDPSGVAHVSGASELARCEPGIDALSMDVCDADCAAALAGWTLCSLEIKQLKDVSTKALHAMLNKTPLEYLSLAGGVEAEDDTDPFKGAALLYARRNLLLEGAPGQDGKLRGPPITAGLRNMMYSSTEEYRAELGIFSLRRNPNLNAETVKLLPTWLYADRLDVSGCSNLDDKAVRLLLSPTVAGDDPRGELNRRAYHIDLSDNPQITDDAFAELKPSEDGSLRGCCHSINLAGCLKLTDLALKRLADGGVEGVIISRGSGITGKGIAAMTGKLWVNFAEDMGKPFVATPALDDGSPVAEVPDPWIVKDADSLKAMPRRCKRVRAEGIEDSVAEKLFSNPGIEELDLRGCDKLTVLPELIEASNGRLQRLDLRGCKGLHVQLPSPNEPRPHPLEHLMPMHLAVDGAHLFAAPIGLSEDQRKEAREFVALAREVINLEIEETTREFKTAEEQIEFWDALKPKKYKLDEMQLLSQCDPARAVAAWPEMVSACVELLDSLDTAAKARLAGKGEREKLLNDYRNAYSRVSKFTACMSSLIAEAFPVDAQTLHEHRLDELQKSWAGRLADLEKKLEEAEEKDRDALWQQREDAKEVTLELKELRLVSNNLAREKLVSDLQSLPLFYSLRVEGTSYWCSAHLAALAQGVTCTLELDLSNNAGLTDTDIDTLLRVRRLRYVNLKGCKGISEAAVKKLIDARPAAKIER